MDASGARRRLAASKGAARDAADGAPAERQSARPPGAAPTRRSARSSAFFVHVAALAAVFALSRFSLERGPVAGLLVGRPSPFDAEKAEAHIKTLSEMGPRVTGTRLCVLGEEYAEGVLRSFGEAAEANGWNYTVERQRMEDGERGSQAMALSGGRGTFFQTYSGISNVIAVFDPPGTTPTTPVVLLNCHIDTASSSGGGAGDDTMGCAVMLEAARQLSLLPAAGMRNPVAFLFNGNEEGGLNGAHMFLAHPRSPLSRRAKLIVNLEACGSKGPAAVFQLRGAGLLRAFRKGASWKHLSVVFGDVFRTGALVSDTDFRHWAGEGVIAYEPGYAPPDESEWPGPGRRVFPIRPRRVVAEPEFGGDPDHVGMDMATFADSYRYHTPLDTFEAIGKGVVGKWGADVLGTLVEVLKEGVDGTWTTGEGHENAEGVWFDWLGFLVAYGARWMAVLHAAAAGGAIAAFLVFAAGTVRAAQGPSSEAVLALVRTVASTFAAPVAAVASALAASRLMRYHPWGQELLFFGWEPLPLFLYAPAALAGAVAALRLVAGAGSPASPDARTATVAHLPLLALMTYGMTSAGLGSSYLPAIHAACLSLYALFPALGPAFPIFPWTCGVPLILSALRFIVPLMGRIGTPQPSPGTTADSARWLTDDILAGIAALLAWAVAHPLLPHISFSIRPPARVLLLVAALPIVVAPFVLRPFDADHPKRLYLQLGYNTTSGLATFDFAHADRGWTAFDAYLRLALAAPPEDRRTAWDRIAEQAVRTDKEAEWDVGWPRSPMVASLRVPAGELAAVGVPPRERWPGVEVLSDVPEGNGRRLLLRFRVAGLVGPAVSFSGCTVEWWDVEGGKPGRDEVASGRRTVVKHAKGFGADSFELEMVAVPDSGPGGKIRVELWGMDATIFGNGTAGSWGAFGDRREGNWWEPAVWKFKERTPDWVTPSWVASMMAKLLTGLSPGLATLRVELFETSLRAWNMDAVEQMVETAGIRLPTLTDAERTFWQDMVAKHGDRSGAYE
ncbi:hypothetical protein DFJ74DRAFT_774438 [Hyaloraphidium curvatum]|nr:hypothetical protein DFJ74DRAFT_774438 [Hyaloraphidium curvatum]